MKRFAPVLLVVLLLCACQESMKDAWFVDKFRILGIRAADPEVTVAFPHGTKSLPTFTPARTTLEALVADPKGEGRAVTLQWSVCTLANIGRDAQDFNCDGDNGIRLAGDVFAPALLVATLAQQGRHEGFDTSSAEGFTGSLQSGVPVYLWLRARAGDESTAALKRVVMSGRTDRNRNPRLTAILADGVDITKVGEVSFKAGREFGFVPVWDEASLDRYEDEVNGVTKTEEPFFSWFTTEGEWDAHYTFPADPSNKWRTPSQTDGTPRKVDLWFVMHDGRGGQDWFALKGATIVP